jgi:hypothetical protein
MKKREFKNTLNEATYQLGWVQDHLENLGRALESLEMPRVVAPLEFSRFSFRKSHLAYNKIVLEFDMPGDMTNAEAKEYAKVKWAILAMVNSALHLAGVEQYIVDGGGTETCAFCDIHSESDCGECPIKLATGHTWCSGTPYNDYGGKDWSTAHNADVAWQEYLFIAKLGIKDG